MACTGSFLWNSVGDSNPETLPPTYLQSIEDAGMGGPQWLAKRAELPYVRIRGTQAARRRGHSPLGDEDDR